MFKRSLAAAASAALILTFALSAPAGTVIDRVVAIVGNDIITLSQLQSEMAPSMAAVKRKFAGDDLAREMSHLKRDTLNQLIDRTLQIAEAKKLGITVPKEDLDAALNDIMSRNKMTEADFKKALSAEGYTYSEYRANLEDQLLVIKLINLEVRSKVIVDESEAEEYYEEHKDKYTTPASVTIANIFFPADDGGMEAARKNAEDARRKMTEGTPFEQMAVQCTGDPKAGEKCVLGSFKKGELSGKIQDIAFSLKVGEVSQPIEMGNGYQLIKVMQKSEAGTTPYKDVESDIYNELSSRKAEAMFASWLDGLRANTYIEVRE